MPKDRDALSQKRKVILTKNEHFGLTALAVGFAFLLFMGMSICWKDGWSWDSIKQFFGTILVSVFAFMIFVFVIFRSLGYKLVQKLPSFARPIIYSLIYLSLLIFLIWYFLCDVHEHRFNVRISIFLGVILIFGFLRIAAPMMAIGIRNKRLSKIFYQVSILAPWGLIGALIVAFLAACYWARYGH